MLRKAKRDFERSPKIPLNVRREQQALEAPVAMADYIRARAALLERMVQLRAARLQASTTLGRQRIDYLDRH